MAEKTQSEIYEILKNARHEYSYNYCLDFDMPGYFSNTPTPFFEYWKFADVLHAFNDIKSVNWRNIESIISSQSPSEYTTNLPTNWTNNHFRNYYSQRTDDKPIEISRYAGWALANQLQNNFFDTSFQKAYFMNPGASEDELAKEAQKIDYSFQRSEISKTVSRINGIIGTLAEKHLINHSQISCDFWRSIYTKLFGQNYNFNPSLANKRGYLDYMNYKLLKELNKRLSSMVNQWDTDAEIKETPNNLIKLGESKMNGIQNVLQCQPIMLIENKKLTPIAANFMKQEQQFIQQYIKPKSR